MPSKTCRQRPVRSWPICSVALRKTNAARSRQGGHPGDGEGGEEVATAEGRRKAATVSGREQPPSFSQPSRGRAWPCAAGQAGPSKPIVSRSWRPSTRSYWQAESHPPRPPRWTLRDGSFPPIPGFSPTLGVFVYTVLFLCILLVWPSGRARLEVVERQKVRGVRSRLRSRCDSAFLFLRG